MLLPLRTWFKSLSTHKCWTFGRRTIYSRQKIAKYQNLTIGMLYTIMIIVNSLSNVRDMMINSCSWRREVTLLR
ncbi:hypothetical protein L211DRAFT_351094 [Terfezia boudieri ATCC MYA-4762]|uniref:Uncharacterized protein n=1 Tax=Terfezia boudieri ATCC MYA-4762 TaxID=1051890 RepID=A0A3N4LH11_9PEZI|nr:hypothetical protein L211DRAFT_351094 [Terfezia boudieri ATCC MYA-4762]